MSMGTKFGLDKSCTVCNNLPVTTQNTLGRDEMIALKLGGATYAVIGEKAGVSRQRVQQLLRPTQLLRQWLQQQTDGQCQGCGLVVGVHGHIHHQGDDIATWDNRGFLQLLCVGCHHTAHAILPRVYCATCGKRLTTKNTSGYCHHHRPFKHGNSTGYTLHRCRCPECVLWKSERGKEWTLSRSGRKPPVHGLSGYKNWRCRCMICSSANTARNRQYNKEHPGRKH